MVPHPKTLEKISGAKDEGFPAVFSVEAFFRLCYTDIGEV